MKKYCFIFAISLVIILSGCNLNQPIQPINSNQNLINSLSVYEPTITNETKTPETTNFTLLISTEDPLKYCNGANMDTEGYKKTITKEIQTIDFGKNLSQAELARQALIWTSKQSDIFFPQAELEEHYIKIINDTAYIMPTEGWAGVSIALCTWQPFVEVNLLRFPGIKKVEWVNDSKAWQNLK